MDKYLFWSALKCPIELEINGEKEINRIYTGCVLNIASQKIYEDKYRVTFIFFCNDTSNLLLLKGLPITATEIQSQKKYYGKIDALGVADFILPEGRYRFSFGKIVTVKITDIIIERWRSPVPAMARGVEFDAVTKIREYRETLREIINRARDKFEEDKDLRKFYEDPFLQKVGDDVYLRLAFNTPKNVEVRSITFIAQDFGREVILEIPSELMDEMRESNLVKILEEDLSQEKIVYINLPINPVISPEEIDETEVKLSPRYFEVEIAYVYSEE